MPCESHCPAVIVRGRTSLPGPSSGRGGGEVTTFHVYCDESCHGERDGHSAMVLGAVRCTAEHRRAAAEALRDLKVRHGLKPSFELKWTKISPAKIGYYKDVIDLFFEDEELAFRAVVIPDKGLLRHEEHAQTHDDFYFKMYFQLVRHWLDQAHDFRVFLDIKDTRSLEKTRKLHEVLANSQYDFDRKIVRSIELVRSEQVELVQLADLLVGCVSSANRAPRAGSAKAEVVEHLRHRSGLLLTKTTLVREAKVNVFVWRAREAPKG